MAEPNLRWLIDEYTPELCQSIIVDTLFLAKLVAYKVIRDDQRGDIVEMSTARKPSEILRIVRANPETYPWLCRALHETNQNHAHKILTTSLDRNLTSGIRKVKDHYIAQYKSTPSFFCPEMPINMEENYLQTDLTFLRPGANILDSGELVNENEVTDGKAKQVLIDGKAGSGKTTLANRYAWQWATRKGSDFINDLDLVVFCTGPSIAEYGIDASIKQFLSKFDPSDCLYNYCKQKQSSCLVIFEAMDEATDVAQDLVCQYIGDVEQPIIITARTGDFDKAIPLVKKHFHRNMFSEDQALQYFRKTFPDVEKDIKTMLTRGTIDEKLLESPYNCQTLGELLLQDKRNTGTVFEDGQKITTTTLFSQQITQLRKWQSTADDSFLQNLGNLALWATVKDKQRLKKEDLDRFQVTQCKALESFMITGISKGEKMYVFQHQLWRDYMAAYAVLQLESMSRDIFYRFFCSKKKYVAVIRFACGLLNPDKINIDHDFRNIIGHTLLLGEVKHQQTLEREAIVHVSKQKVHSILQELGGAAVFKAYSPTPKEIVSLANYKKEYERYVHGTMSDAEVLSLLDGDNGRSCFSWPTLYLFHDIYLCLDELKVEDKGQYDFVKHLIGKGLRKNDPKWGTMHVFPVTGTNRWGQMLINDKYGEESLWILTHSVADAKEALMELSDFCPRFLAVCIPSSFGRKVWGMTECEDLTYICRELLPRNPRRVVFFLDTPLQLMNALQGDLEKMVLSLHPRQGNTEEVWHQFLDYMIRQPLGVFIVSFYHMKYRRDGFMNALVHKDPKDIKVKEFRALAGVIELNHALAFKQKLPTGITFRFDRVVISEVNSIPDIVCLMNDNMLMGTALRHSKDLECIQDDCNKAISAKWSTTEASADTTELYIKVLEKVTCLDSVKYELPSCQDSKNLENVERILKYVLHHFNSICQRENPVTLSISTTVSAVQEAIKAAAIRNDVVVEWQKKEGNITAAELIMI